MLLALFALALFAAVRGWFPWSLGVFGLAYCLSIVDYGSVTHATSLSYLGIHATAGSLLEWGVGGMLGTMIVFDRS